MERRKTSDVGLTAVSTLADSYLHSTSHSAGSAAETASNRKETKYSSLPPDFIFQPVATEILGPVNASALNFFSEEIHTRPHFDSSAFQCLYSASTLVWLRTPSVSLTKTWTSSHQWRLFLASSFFNSGDLYTTWGIIIIINLVLRVLKIKIKNNNMMIDH